MLKIIFACSVIGLLYLLALKADKLMEIINEHEDIMESDRLDKQYDAEYALPIMEGVFDNDIF